MAEIHSCNCRSDGMYIIVTFIVVLVLLCQQLHVSESQQLYINNKQNDCYNQFNSTAGYICNGPSSCRSYLTFRSNPPGYDSAATIASFLRSDASSIVKINNLSSINAKIPKDTIIIIPLNCSCSSQGYYQHNSSYQLKSSSETYFFVANDTYEGLTTCQALMAQNPSYDSHNLSAGVNLTVPLRCACPTSNQTTKGVNYLLTYLVTWGNSIPVISQMFGGVDNKSILDANQLTDNSIIFPFTSLLVPLTTVPTKIQTVASPPPSPPPPAESGESSGSNSSHKKWVFLGIGLGAALFLILALCFFFFFIFRRKHKGEPVSSANKPEESAILPHNKQFSVSSQGIRYAVESMTVYKLEDLQKATGDFSEANRIKGSVYRGSFKGDNAAIKIMKEDVSSEINILKQINHTNIIRLSGFCVHQGNTYLVYEYAENSSLSDWLHIKKYQSSNILGWKQRVQIACDAADALNYLHNYTNPPYIHKNLKSSNILLDFNLRAKVANFGLARSVESQEEGGLQLTRHVVGTQGYMAPEYIDNGVITPKLDVFAFGVILLEILSGKEPVMSNAGEELLWTSISRVLGGENVREKLRDFIDPCLNHEYPLDLAFSLANLANKCVAHDVNSRPTMSDVFMTLSKILSSSLDWDPSDEHEHSK